MRFADRERAGLELARRLAAVREAGGLPGPVTVLALPRGGVPVAVPVARRLGAPLDVLVVRKIGAPDRPEVAVGAVTADGPAYLDDDAVGALGVPPGELSRLTGLARTEAGRREAVYRGGRPAPPTAGRSVVVVDDGLATGSTARVALRSVRAAGAPRRLVLAVPVGPAATVAALDAEADEVVCASVPAGFVAVGQWYDDFGQLTDAEVTAALARPAG